MHPQQSRKRRRAVLWRHAFCFGFWSRFGRCSCLRPSCGSRSVIAVRRRVGASTALLLAVLCPPLRLCMRHADREGKVWFPGFGWQAVNEDLRQRLERNLTVPMLIIALMILPVLLVEFAMVDQVASRVWLQVVLGVSTGLIWFAFAAEFIVMVTMADKKLRYCKQHWLDLAIILLPLISFLRSLREARAVRAVACAGSAVDENGSSVSPSRTRHASVSRRVAPRTGQPRTACQTGTQNPCSARTSRGERTGSCSPARRDCRRGSLIASRQHPHHRHRPCIPRQRITSAALES